MNRTFFKKAGKFWSQNWDFKKPLEVVILLERGKGDSVKEISDYVGSVEINDIRRAYEAKHKGKVDMKQMHDTMLSFGSPAAKYVKEMMGL